MDVVTVGEIAASLSTSGGRALLLDCSATIDALACERDAESLRVVRTATRNFDLELAITILPSSPSLCRDWSDSGSA
jgi:hypothetical protein